MRQNILAAEKLIADTVVQAIEEVFNAMFRQPVLAGKATSFPDPNNVVLTRVKLHHGDTDLEFSFAFDMRLLFQIAEFVFTPEYIKSHTVHEDLAAEIADIVCHKVKALLNEEGIHTEMSMPFIPAPGQDGLPEKGEFVQMHFFYRDKDANRKVGVAINCFVV